MDSTSKRLEQEPSPYLDASWISKQFFWYICYNNGTNMFSHKSDFNICFRWLTPFLWKGFNKNLKNEDLYRVLPEDDSKFLGDKLERYIYKLYNVCLEIVFKSKIILENG